MCHNVATEPPLQPLSGEILNHHTASKDGARLDTRARGFWNGAQDAFFDVRVFHPNASSYRSLSLQAALRRHEQAKKREYGERVHEGKHGVFTPPVLSTTGGLGCEASTFYKRLAGHISSKQQKHTTPCHVLTEMLPFICCSKIYDQPSGMSGAAPLSNNRILQIVATLLILILACES